MSRLTDEFILFLLAGTTVFLARLDSLHTPYHRGIPQREIMQWQRDDAGDAFTELEREAHSRHL